MRGRCGWLLATVLVLVACGGGQPEPGQPSGPVERPTLPPTEPPDAGSPDAGAPDAGTSPDSGTADGGGPDAGMPLDAGSPDAGSLDGGAPETERGATRTRHPFEGEVLEAGTDAAGNTYVRLRYRAPASFQGQSLPDDGSGRFQNALVKLDLGLAPTWAIALPISEGRDIENGAFDVTFRLAVSPGGAVVLAGTYYRTLPLPTGTLSGRPFPYANGYVARIGPDGTWQWSRNLTTDESLQVAAVAARDDAIALTGRFEGASEELGLPASDVYMRGFALRLDAEGDLRGSHVFNGPINGRGEAIALTATGDAVVLGSITYAIPNGTEESMVDTAYLARLEPSGRVRWEKRFMGKYELGLSTLALGPQGDIAVAGSISSEGPVRWGRDTLPSSAARSVLLTMDANGEARWGREIGQLSPVSLGMDARGWLTLSGKGKQPVDFGGGPRGADGPFRLLLARLRPDGSHVWSYSLDLKDARPWGTENPFSVAVLADGRARVAGYDALIEVVPR